MVYFLLVMIMTIKIKKRRIYDMKRIITAVMITVITVFMITGCGNKTSVETETMATTETNTQECSKEGTKEPATQDTAEEGSAEENTSGLTYPYTYVDAAGREVVIENEPLKIAVDYLPLWETLIMLDIMPIAASGAENYKATWDAFKGYDVSSVQELGANEVNLELLAELEPDIILDQAYDISNLDIENLEKISTVAVFGPETKMDWRLSLREVAKVVNKEAKAEEVIAEIDAKLSTDRAKLDEKYNGETVLQVSVMGEDKYYCAYRADLYDDETGLGLNVPEGYTTSENYEQISMEAIVEMNPDYIFLNVFDGDEAVYEALADNEVWKSLKAVQSGHVYLLDGGGHACSPLATVYTVDFMTNALLAE
jgi:iron complex transport system substrate-binding protein